MLIRTFWQCLICFFFGIFVTLLEKFLKTEIRCNTCETYRWGRWPQRNEGVGHKVRAVFGQDRHQHNKIHVKLKGDQNIRDEKKVHVAMGKKR